MGTFQSKAVIHFIMLLVVICEVSNRYLVFSVHAQARVKMHEANFRKLAVKIIMPTYPEQSKKNGASGVAVIEIEIDESGKLSQTKVLEAPDKYIEKNVLSAIKKWEFKADSVNGKPVRVQSKLTFYFKIKQSVAYVLSPQFLNAK